MQMISVSNNRIMFAGEDYTLYNMIIAVSCGYDT